MKKTLLLALVAGGLLHASHSARAQSFIGLQSGGVTLTEYTAPGATPTTYTVGGLNSGDTLVGIDRLPAADSSNQLYGMSGSGVLYTLNRTSATTYTATVSATSGVTGVTTIDFNPMANRLRFYTSSNTTNRLTPGTGTYTPDGMLSFAANDQSTGTPSLTATAYTNNVASPTSTRLFSLDSLRDILVENVNGTGAAGTFAQLNTVGGLTLGGLSFNIGAGTTGFDIVTIGGAQTAFVSSGGNLYSLNLSNAVLTSLGAISANTIDIAFIPEPGTYAMLALGLGAGALVLRRRRLAA